ncbi:TPA: hypothetical protein ACKRFF_003010 [Providencia stuartii]|uniref:hypothetical protein n=1 Tax=Providencia TaxID=586 RepID=UPI0013D47D10|nr:hypothetical protein [Providencia sp. PROV041]
MKTPATISDSMTLFSRFTKTLFSGIDARDLPALERPLLAKLLLLFSFNQELIDMYLLHWVNVKRRNCLSCTEWHQGNYKKAGISIYREKPLKTGSFSVGNFL